MINAFVTIKCNSCNHKELIPMAVEENTVDINFNKPCPECNTWMVTTSWAFVTYNPEVSVKELVKV